MSETSIDQLIEYLVFAALLLIEGYVFIALKGRIDTSGIVTLLIYLLASFFRILPTIFEMNITIDIMVDFTTQVLVWFVIYYFSFEILKIEATFKGTHPREVAKAIKGIDLRKLVFLILLVGVVAPILTCVLYV
jgi:hypothetical protein